MRSDRTGHWTGELDGPVGRGPVLTAVRGQLDSGARTVVVTGTAGSGKTSVLRAVGDALEAEGRLVLRVTGYASERDLAFGVLVDLLAGTPDAEVVLQHVLPDAERARAVDPLRLRLAVLAHLEHLGESGAIALVVDDLQWCDDSTLSVLGFIANRLTGSEISLLAATRDDVPPTPLRHHPHLTLPPLTDAEARALLRRAGFANPLPSVLERAAGNPLALLELSRAAAGSGPGGPPSSVEMAFRELVSALPDSTRWLLLTAALGDGDLAVLGRATDAARLAPSLAPAEVAGLAEVVHGTVHFRHPLVAAAVQALSTTTDRLAVHAALAAAHGDDPERAAWHRAAGTLVADEDVARALVTASSLAMRRGASTEAARLMVRASELSPDRPDREERLLRAVQMSVNAGDFDWVVEAGGRLRVEAQDAAVRARAAQSTAYALAQRERSGAARRALVRALEELVEVDPASGWSTLSTLAVVTYRTGWDRAELERWLEVYDAATDPAAPGEYPALLPAARAWIRMQVDPLSNPEDVVDLVRHSPVPAYPPPVTASHEMLLGAAAWLLDEPVLARERLARSVDLMRSADAPGEMTQALIALALVHLQLGDYDAADEAGRLISDIAESRNQHYGLSDGYELRARVAALRGEIDRAQELCDLVLSELPVGEASAIELTLGVTRSWVRLGEHDVWRAWSEVRGLFDEDGTATHPHISYRELGHYAGCAARVGELDRLAAVVTVAERRIPAPRPFHQLQLARARALLQGPDAEARHREAVGAPTATQWPFELACAHLEYGSWLRRRHRPTEARQQLQQALAVFERLGARVSAQLADAELRAAGVPTHVRGASAWAELTAQEREVVRLAADGRTNPEIASALYLSPRTVSTHLYNAFPKLGVTSRGQLRDVVPDATGSPPRPRASTHGPGRALPTATRAPSHRR